MIPLFLCSCVLEEPFRIFVIGGLLPPLSIVLRGGVFFVPGRMVYDFGTKLRLPAMVAAISCCEIVEG